MRKKNERKQTQTEEKIKISTLFVCWNLNFNNDDEDDGDVPDDSDHKDVSERSHRCLEGPTNWTSSTLR